MSEGYTFKTVGVKGRPYVFELELIYNDQPVARYHTVPESEIESGNESEAITCASVNPVTQNRLLVVLGKTKSSNDETYIYDAWLLDNSLSNNSSMTTSKYCYYINDGSTVQPDYHFEYHYYDTTSNNLVEIPWALLSQQDKDVFNRITDLFHSYEPVLQATIEYDETHMMSEDIKLIGVFDDYVRDIKTIMAGGKIEEDFYASEFLFSDIYPFLPPVERGQEEFIIHSEIDRQSVLRTTGPIIDFSNSNFVFDYPKLQKEVILDTNYTVTFNGSPISQMSPLNDMMSLAKDMMLLTLVLPKGRGTVERYAAKGMKLSPDTSLENLYVLQQALNNYEDKLQPVATKAILARFGILKRSDKLLDVEYSQLLQQANIRSFPTVLIDAYLEVQDIIKRY